MYLDKYILPDGNFLYNTEDQVEAPLNVGVFLANTARAYDYTGDLGALEAKLPALRRMVVMSLSATNTATVSGVHQTASTA